MFIAAIRCRPKQPVVLLLHFCLILWSWCVLLEVASCLHGVRGGRVCQRSWLLECLETQNSYGPNDMCASPPILADSQNWRYSKKTIISWGRLENTFLKEIRLGTAHDTFQPMELRVPKLVRLPEICSIGITSIPFSGNITNMISYHGLIWAVDHVVTQYQTCIFYDIFRFIYIYIYI